VIILFGNPSSGGANGSPTCHILARDRALPPPRNAYILLRQTIYFHGTGTSLALTVLLYHQWLAGAAGFAGPVER
jgi:hypothetical protein